MDDLLVTAPLVLAPDTALAPGWIAVTGDRITAVGTGAPPPAGVRRDLAGTLVPGLVDLHVHGGGGAMFTAAADEPDAVARVVDAHRRHGTTTSLASLVSAAPGLLQRQVAALADLADDGLVDGIHLEGPWLSPSRAGAHDPAALRPPDPAELEALLRAGRGHVRLVTLAPELDGGLDAVRRIVAAGAVAAVGHTDADHATTVRALDAGATLATHLFNAMPPLHHRAPGPVGALLADPRCTVELVADGVHVHPDVLRVAATAAGAGRWALVTDAVAPAGARDRDDAGHDRWTLGAVEVVVADGVARTTSGALAGSTLTMDAAVALTVGAAGLALPAAVAAATSTPAALLGFADRGRLAPGARADAVELSTTTGAAGAVLVSGRWFEGGR